MYVINIWNNFRSFIPYKIINKHKLQATFMLIDYKTWSVQPIINLPRKAFTCMF